MRRRSWRELDTRHIDVQSRSQGTDQQRLCDAGHTFQQRMAAGHQGDQQTGYRSVLADHGLGDFTAQTQQGIEDVLDHGDTKLVKTDDETYEAKTVIVATGAKHRLLGVPGEAEFNSRGVSYCAVCDGAFFRDQDLAVVGGGDSAVEEAIYLTQFAKSVTIIHRRDELRAQKILQDRAFANPKISFLWDSVVEEIKGDDVKVQELVIKNVKTGELESRAFGGVFIYVGLIPVSQMVKNLGITDQEGWIKTDASMATSLPGVFAIGDIRQKDLRQITTAVGDGAQAGVGVYQYLQNH